MSIHIIAILFPNVAIDAILKLKADAHFLYFTSCSKCNLTTYVTLRVTVAIILLRITVDPNLIVEVTCLHLD
jgi:hypothetical protein